MYTLSASAVHGSYVASGTASATVAVLSVSVAVSGSIFAAHQTVVPINANVAYDGAPAAATNVTFTVTKPRRRHGGGNSGDRLNRQSCVVLKVAQKDPLGTYSVVATATSNGNTVISSSAVFLVK